MRRTRITIVAMFAVFVLAVTGCGGVPKKSDFWGGAGSSGVSGTVYDRHGGKIRRLYVRDAEGNRYGVRVRLSWYLRCHEGEAYPACAHKKGR